MTAEYPCPPGLTPEQNDAKLTMEAAMMAYDVAHFEWNEGNDAGIGPWKRMIQAHDTFDKAWKAYIVAIDKVEEYLALGKSTWLANNPPDWRDALVAYGTAGIQDNPWPEPGAAVPRMRVTRELEEAYWQMMETRRRRATGFWNCPEHGLDATEVRVTKRRKEEYRACSKCNRDEYE